eukprot:TRINITY_DN11270_c0_g1_i1.p1 TRINITY_DN11270_c0_g1~~TRINITY_DN11270_c0_g1_i1.p1  ORF type:complete len:389 (-),score=151.57 TRINITY_DN11270_c0_g1_i1:78-1244(-)
MTDTATETPVVAAEAVPVVVAAEEVPVVVAATEAPVVVAETPVVEKKEEVAEKKEDNVNEKIKTQVEFYFGDSNLRRDNFLSTKIAEGENGFVAITVLTTFNRLKVLSEDIPTIASALKDSEVVEVSEDGTKVRRKGEVTELSKEEGLSRSIYMKGFKPATNDCTIEHVKELLAGNGEVVSVRLRRIKKNRIFKGSCFVEFKTAEEATAATKLSITSPFSRGPLRIIMKEEYIKEKDAEWDEKKVKIEERANQKKEKEAAEEKKFSYDQGKIVNFTGMDTSKTDVNRMTLKGEIETHGTGNVKFIDFNTGDVGGFLRYENPEQAKAAVEKLNADKPELCGCKELVFRVIEGTEEGEYWDKVFEKRDSTVTKRKRKMPNQGRGGYRKRR